MASRVAFNFRGILPAVFTPLNSDLSINYGVIPAYAQFLQKSGMKGILVCGTTGESMSLRLSDRKKLVDAWVKEAKTTGMHVQVQVGGAPLPDVLELTKHCATAGVDSLLTLPELYFKPKNISEVVSYVDYVAKAAPNLPLFYYHSPRTGVVVNLPELVMTATASIPNFKGLKYAFTDLAEAAQLLNYLKDDQHLLLATFTLLAPGALLGITTGTAPIASLYPQLCQDVLAAVEASDLMKARALQQELTAKTEAIIEEGYLVPAAKAAMEIVTGLKMGPPVPPQAPLSAEAIKRLQTKLRYLN